MLTPQTTEPAVPAAPSRLVTPRFTLFLAATAAWFFSGFVLQAALPRYLEARGFSNGMIGLVIGALSVSAIAPRFRLGRAMDRGALMPLLVLSGLLMLTSPLYGLGTALWLMLGVRLVQGISTAIYATGSVVLTAALAPDARRGEALGLVSLASTLAIATGPPLGLLFGERVSYSLTFALSAGAGLLAALLLVPLRYLTPGPFRITEGEKMQRASLLEWSVLPAVVPSVVVGLGNGALFAFLVPLMTTRGLPGAGFFFTFDALMFFLIRAVGGRWSDRYGRWRVLVPALAALGAALAILAAVPTFPAFVATALVWGGAIGLVIPELNALAVDLAPPERRGAALATQTGVFEAGILIAGLTLGWVADRLSLPFIFALCAALLLLTAAWAHLTYGRGTGMGHREARRARRRRRRNRAGRW